MEEKESKTYTDKEIWKKASSINKAKYLALMGPATQKSLWIMAAVAVAVVVALMILMPMPDPQITSASQYGDKIALLADNNLMIADKTGSKAVKVGLDVNALSVAAGSQGIVVTNRAENRLLFFGWDGKEISKMDVASPIVSCFGKDWLYCISSESIDIYKDFKKINSMPAPKTLLVRSIFEHEAIWVADQSMLWSSGPDGWIPYELPVDSKKLKSIWIDGNIKTLVGKTVTTFDLQGKIVKTEELPSWCSMMNTWVCSDVVSISGSQILIGSVSDSLPKSLEIPK